MPKCECHGVEKKWENDKRKTKGGFWRCVVKHRRTRYLAQSKYRKTIKGYITDRKFELKAARQKILIQMEELHKCQIN